MKMRRKMLSDAERRMRKRLNSLTSQKARTHYSSGRLIHCDKLHKWPVAYDQDNAWEAFKDTLPRAPLAFLAMVAEQQRKRQLAAKVGAKRDKGRSRYLKRMRRGHPGAR